MEYYQPTACLDALAAATVTINERTKALQHYTRGTNDCVALLTEYDRILRQGHTKAALPFTWENTRGFVLQLRRYGFTMAQYMESCGYQIIENKRPQIGDVAFEHGAMIAGQSGWVSTRETNEGVAVKRQMLFLERRLTFLARPTKGT